MIAQLQAPLQPGGGSRSMLRVGGSADHTPAVTARVAFSEQRFSGETGWAPCWRESLAVAVRLPYPTAKALCTRDWLRANGTH